MSFLSSTPIPFDRACILDNDLPLSLLCEEKKESNARPAHRCSRHYWQILYLDSKETRMKGYSKIVLHSMLCYSKPKVRLIQECGMGPPSGLFPKSGEELEIRGKSTLVWCSTKTNGRCNHRAELTRVLYMCFGMQYSAFAILRS